MIKIAFLVPYKILPPVTGGEKGIFYFLKHFAIQQDVTVTCFTVSENAGNVAGVDFIDVLGSTKNKFRYANFFLFKKIKKICKQKNIRHLIIEHPYYAWLGISLKKWGGLKLIVRSHNIEATRFKSMNKWWWPVLQYYEKQAHRNADLNSFVTEEDKEYAIKKYGLNAGKCIVATYGIEADTAPSLEEKKACKMTVCKELGIDASTKLILFNGTLDYAPNRNALDRILNEINPELLKTASFPYKIVVCGLRLPKPYNELKEWQNENIIYKGFVEDIELYFKTADVFLNPITDGGGIKTKLVEALGANTRSVSYKSGAYGIPQSVVGSHLSVIENGDYKAFAEAIIWQLQQPFHTITTEFYKHFSWNAIAGNVVKHIQALEK